MFASKFNDLPGFSDGWLRSDTDSRVQELLCNIFLIVSFLLYYYCADIDNDFIGCRPKQNSVPTLLHVVASFAV